MTGFVQMGHIFSQDNIGTYLGGISNIVNICDLMGQNQSHVAIFPYGVQYTSF